MRLIVCEFGGDFEYFNLLFSHPLSIGPERRFNQTMGRAGLLPALRRGAIADSDGWKINVFKPGAQPLTPLAAHLARLDAREAMGKTVDEPAEILDRLLKFGWRLSGEQ